MTDHHKHHAEGAEPTAILYTVAEYRAGSERRELLLVDLPGLNLTLVDLLATSDDDQHIVAAGLENYAQAGDVADEHVANSIELGRPAVPTAEPPTDEQLRFLSDQARRLGDRAFQPPRSKAEAAKWIRRSSPTRSEAFDPRRAARELWEAANAGRRA